MPHGFSYYISQIVSVVFHPLLMPFHGMIILIMSVYLSGEANRYLMAAVLGSTARVTLLWTFIIPLAFILVLLFLGRITSISMPEQSDRHLPYFACSVCYMVWCAKLWMAHVPVEWLLTAMGGTLALLVVAAVNRHWKISAHATGVGGVLGSVLAYSVASGWYSWTLLLTVAFITIAVMWARIRLERHTPLQVSAGWLTGLLCTLLPVYIYSKTVLY